VTADNLNAAGREEAKKRRRWTPVARIFRLTLKELRETLRDRRTIATLLLMPILVYPLLSVAFQKFLVTNIKTAVGRSDYVLGFRSETEAQQLRPYLFIGDSILESRERSRADRTRRQHRTSRDNRPPAESSTEDKMAALPGTLPTPYDVVPDFRESLADGRVDVVILVRKTEPFPAGGTLDKAIDCELMYDPQSSLSREAQRWVESCLRAVNEQSLENQLRARGARARLLPVSTDSQPVESAASSRPSGPSLATLVPLILILMTITGAVYPAIDLTAGERERGTLEMLIAAPVPRMQLLLAKYVAVLTVALLTAIVNLGAMVVTVLSIGLGSILFGDAGASVGVLVEIVALLILFAAFFSAVLLAVTSFARSFKEAQAYLIPLMLVSIAPGMLSMIPDLKLEGPLVVTPLVNIVLLARDLLRHAVEPATAIWVVMSTALFAVAAIGVAARIFGTDAILYGSHGTWSDLFRRPLRRSSAPTPTSALLSLAILFPAYFLTSNLVARSDIVSLENRLLLGAFVTILVFAQIPLAVAVLNRVDLVSGFQLRPASPFVFAGALVLAVSIWPFAHEIVVLMNRWGLVALDQEILEQARNLIQKIWQVSPILLVGTLAVVPAFCEEFFFRGFLLAALRDSLTATKAIVVSSVLFGVFHLIAIDQLHFERLLPSTMLGLVLGWLCIRCGSALPGMVLHATYNSVLLLGAHFQKDLAKWGWGLEEKTDVETAGLPMTWLIAATIGTAVGLAIVQLATRRTWREHSNQHR